MASTSGEPLRELIGSVAHELSTPLSVIASAVSLLERGGLEDPDRYREVVEALRRNVTLASLVVRRLQGAYIADDHLELDPVPTDLTRLVRTTVKDLRRTLLRHHPTDLELPEQLVVTVDPDLVRETLYNLLSNAVKYSPPERPIQVMLTRDGNLAEIAVQDQGKGVAPEDAERIFERFGRADDAKPGLGVGLYLARRIARAHGGDVVLDADAPERGARFLFRLPID